jgi:hypothetical protein
VHRAVASTTYPRTREQRADCRRPLSVSLHAQAFAWRARRYGENLARREDPGKFRAPLANCSWYPRVVDPVLCHLEDTVTSLSDRLTNRTGIATSWPDLSARPGAARHARARRAVRCSPCRSPRQHRACRRQRQRPTLPLKRYICIPALRRYVVLVVAPLGAV